MTSYATSVAQKNLLKGRSEERNLLKRTFDELCKGKSKEDLISESYGKETIDTAISSLRQN